MTESTALAIKDQKLCECGCGQAAPIAAQDWPKFGHVKGQPMRFCRGHYLKLHPLRVHRCWPSAQERFNRYIDKSGDCWLWTGARTGNGYGAFGLGGKQEGAHRAAWILANGPIPENLLVLHSCDNPLCVRIDHLSLGTILDNSADMVNRGRAAKGLRSGHYTHPERTARGEKNGSAVLTESAVQQIRRLYSLAQPVKSIAAQFHVTDMTIRHIIRGKTWKHVLEVAS